MEKKFLRLFVVEIFRGAIAIWRGQKALNSLFHLWKKRKKIDSFEIKKKGVFLSFGLRKEKNN